MNKQSDSDSDTLQSSSATSSRTFRIPTHSDNILAMLNKQRETGEYCDVTVLVEHQRFSAHKCILAANSPYLQSLMAGNSDGVLLRQISSSSFKSIIDFMYTSKLQLVPVTVQDVLNAAKLLQIRSVVSICCRYLESQLMHIAKDVTGTSKGNHHHHHSKPVAVAIDTTYPSPRQLGQSVASSNMIPQSGGFYNGNIPQMAPNAFSTGRQSVQPPLLPQDYKLPTPIHHSPTKRFEFSPHQQNYRPYHSGRQSAFNTKLPDQQSMYGQTNGRTGMIDFMSPPQQPWISPGFQRSNHAHPVSNGAKKSSSARDSKMGREMVQTRHTTSDNGNRGQLLSSCNGRLPRVNSGQSHFAIEPEDRYFHKKYTSNTNRSKNDDETAFVREFKHTLPLRNSPKSDDHFSNVSYY